MQKAKRLGYDFDFSGERYELVFACRKQEMALAAGWRDFRRKLLRRRKRQAISRKAKRIFVLKSGCALHRKEYRELWHAAKFANHAISRLEGMNDFDREGIAEIMRNVIGQPVSIPWHFRGWKKKGHEIKTQEAMQIVIEAAHEWHWRIMCYERKIAQWADMIKIHCYGNCNNNHHEVRGKAFYKHEQNCTKLPHCSLCDIEPIY